MTHPEIHYIRIAPAIKYAIHGMAFLAKKQQQRAGGFCLVEDVAKNQRLPKDFLGKIFQKLGHKNILISHRGPGGGYALARPVKEITLADIAKAVEENPGQGQCLLGLTSFNEGHPCRVHKAIAQADKILQETFSRMTLETFVKRGLS